MARPKNTPTKTTQGAGRRKLVPGTHLTQLQIDFLEHCVATGGKIADSAKLTGINRHSHYKWVWNEPHYAAAYQGALLKAKQVREDKVRAAIREAWEIGWDEETVEQTLVGRPNPQDADGPPIMVPVEVRRKTSKKRFPNALFYEANSLFGNPARLQVNTVGATKISIEGLRDLLERAESVEQAEASGNPDD